MNTTGPSLLRPKSEPSNAPNKFYFCPDSSIGNRFIERLNSGRARALGILTSHEPDGSAAALAVNGIVLALEQFCLDPGRFRATEYDLSSSASLFTVRVVMDRPT